PEVLSRREWAEANLASMRPLLDPLTERLGDGLGPAAASMRAGAGVLLAAELGAVVGYLGQRVLGQYELALLDPGVAPRLLFVGPNLDDAARKLEVDEHEFLRWVALHEVTHAVQFGGVSWLRDHMGTLLRDVLDSVDVSIDPARLLRLPSRDDVRALVDAVGSGDLLSMVATPRQLETIDRVQAAMAVIEGHAEHVMDAVGADVLPSLPALRAAMDRRRSSASGPARLLGRLLGLELKMRQYEQGKRFCDAVVDAGGVAALNRVWAAPAGLPTLAELDDPAAWIARTRVPTVTKS
ncbi:MAG: zinc-dependent metalloprotease, partial [Solirubrobacteraceae bacterium]